MSLDSTLTRIGQIDAMFSATPATTTAATNTAGTATNATSATSTPTFADALIQASTAPSALTDDSTDQPSTAATATTSPADLPAGTVAATSPITATGVSPDTGNPTMVAIAATQIGQAEQPNGSNNSPAIAMYRTATAGAQAGEPWCAYFASWVARQAGAPLGDQGQGFGAVSDIWSWAQEHGRAITNGPGVVPKPGDLIVFGGEHVGIVDQVLRNGDIETIEGNYNNQVSQVIRSPTEATGYVSMG